MTQLNSSDISDISNLIIQSLLDACLDESSVISDHVCNVVNMYGKKKTNLVVWTCLSYLQKEKSQKLSIKKKLKLASILSYICKEKMDQIDEDIRNLLESYCISVIGDDKFLNEKILNLSSTIYKFENSICETLVLIGTNHVNEVMDKIFIEFEPCRIPPLFVIKFLGDLALINPSGMIPFIKALLGTIISIIPSIKKDIYKCIFSNTLANFAESIQENHVNTKTSDFAVNQSYFANDFDKAFDFIFNDWIYSKDTRTREQAVRALGIISPLLSKSKFDELEPKLMNALLTFYRRYSISFTLIGHDFNILFATQCLHQLLECIIDRNSTLIIRSQIDNILSTLFNQICILPNYQNPSSIRNHNEILRCFATLSRKHGDLVLPFILQKLETGNEIDKIGALFVLKHLINSCILIIVPKLSVIFFTLRLILNEENNKIRQMIIQVVITIAHHGYLNLDGGQALIQYIIKQCALVLDENEKSDKRLSFDNEVVSNYALKTMSENAMHLLVNTVEGIEKVLWPHLFEYLVSPEYVEALEMLCQSLAFLSEKIGPEELASNRIFDVRSNFPKPESLAARLCVVIGAKPTSNLICPCLKIMKVIGSQIDPKLKPFWSTVIDQFLDLLSSNTSVSEEAWTNKALSFVNQSLIEIDSNGFTMRFGNSLLSQIHLYRKDSYLKKFLLMVLGNVIRRLGDKNFSSNSLDTIFEQINHNIELEKEGFAYVAGQSAARHLDLVLIKLEKFAIFKKSGNVFGLWMDSMRFGVQENEKVRATIILAYGHITKFPPSKLLIARLETPILRTLTFYYNSSKNACTVTAFIQSVNIIANSVLPENLKEFYLFRQRNELLQEMLNILKSPNSLFIHYQLAIDALANLVKLEPVLNDSLKTIVIQTTSRIVYENIEPGSEEILKTFKNLLQQLLLTKKSTPATLELLVQLLKQWFTNTDNVIRENSFDTILYLLQVFHSNIEKWEFKKFDTFGSLIGLIIPRCFDTSLNVQKTAYHCLRLICLISNKLQAISSQNDIALQIFDSIISEPDGYSMSQDDMYQLSTYFSQKFKLESMSAWPLIKNLIDGLIEPFLAYSLGCCQILKYLVDIMESEIISEIPSILDYLLIQMPFINFQETQITLSEMIHSLTSRHLNIVCKHLLNYPLERSNYSNQFWKIIAQEKTLCSNLVLKLFEIIKNEEITATHPQKHQVKIANLRPLGAILALREVFSCHSSEPVACEYFVETFVHILHLVASFLNVEYFSPDLKNANDSLVIEKVTNEPSHLSFLPVQIAIDALKNLLIQSGHKKVLTALNDKTWQLLTNELYFAEAVSILAKTLFLNYSSHIPNFVTILSQNFSNQLYKKLILVIFFSEILLIKHFDQETLYEPLLKMLINMRSDSSPAIRKASIHGLAQFALFYSNINSKLGNSIVSAMMSGLEEESDTEGDILAESLEGLSAILDHIDSNQIELLCVPIAIRIRSFFDKVVIKPLVRSSALKAYIRLAESNQSLLKDIAFNFLIPCMIYLNIKDRKESEICLSALKVTINILDSESLKNLVNQRGEKKNIQNFEEFFNDFIKILATEMSDKYNDLIIGAKSYLKMESFEIQSNAISLLSLLFSHKVGEVQKAEDRIKLIHTLIKFLKESKSNEVKMKAAEALLVI